VNTWRRIIVLRDGGTNEHTLRFGEQGLPETVVVATDPHIDNVLLAGAVDHARLVRAHGWSISAIIEELRDVNIVVTPTIHAKPVAVPAGWQLIEHVVGLRAENDAFVVQVKGQGVPRALDPSERYLMTVTPTDDEHPLMLPRATAPVETWPARQHEDKRQQTFIRVDGGSAENAVHQLYAAVAERNALPSIDTKETQGIDAPMIVAGGMGLAHNPTVPPPGTADPFAWRVQNAFETLLRPLAAALGGGIAASRGVIDAAGLADVPLVGQSGYRVYPKLYVAVGISGQVQHQHGMADAGCIVAINPDEYAPIFEIAHIGVVGDAFEVVPALTRLLHTNRT